MLRKFWAAFCSLACLASPAGASEISEVVGTWKTVRHGAHVSVVDCGDGSPCGHLIAVGNGIANGFTRDEKNPDRSLRSRPLEGVPILWGYSLRDGSWRDGRLYNPETGQTFRSSLTLLSENTLKVRGCLGPLCRSQTWTRILDETAIMRED